MGTQTFRCKDSADQSLGESCTPMAVDSCELLPLLQLKSDQAGNDPLEVTSTP